MAQIFKHSTFIRIHDEFGDQVIAQWFHEGDECPNEIVDQVDKNHFFSEEMVDEGEPGENLSSLTVAQLREVLKARGLDTSGNKGDLIDRIQAHDASVS